MSEELKLPLDSGTLEKTAWHYTNAKGLLGILESNEIRASSPRFVNDKSEMTYGLAKMKEFWSNGSDFQGIHGHSKDFISEALDEKDFENQIDNTFFVSASKNGNNLNQWRNYSGSDGFAIELDLETNLCHKGLIAPVNGLGMIEGLIFSDWYDVNYDETSLEKRFLELIRFLPQIQDFTQLKSHDAKISFAKVVLMSNFLKFKHPAYLHEEEIRYVIATDDSIQPDYVEKNGLIRPYLGLHTCDSEISKSYLPLPILNIRCGPEMKNGEVKMIKEMMNTYGYETLEVFKSNIPFTNR